MCTMRPQLQLVIGKVSPVVLQTQADLQLNFSELAQVVSSLGLMHAQQQIGLKVGHIDGYCRPR